MYREGEKRNLGNLWPFCEKPVCPDPVRKPVTQAGGRADVRHAVVEILLIYIHIHTYIYIYIYIYTHTLYIYIYIHIYI